jgi:hypothetical protein
VPSKLALLLAAVALVAGCGGSGRLSKAKFEERIQNDGALVQQAVAKIRSKTSLTSLAKQVALAEKAVKQAADNLDAAKPPADAEADVSAIVAGLRAIDVQLVKLQQAAKKGDRLAAGSAAQSIQGAPEVKAARKAAADLRKKGYDIGAIGA